MEEAGMEAGGAVENVCAWLASEAGLCAMEVNEARPLLWRERVYTVHRLELLRQEGCLREVFGARITSRLVSDALGRLEATAPALLDWSAPELHGATAAETTAAEAMTTEASQALLGANYRPCGPTL